MRGVDLLEVARLPDGHTWIRLRLQGRLVWATWYGGRAQRPSWPTMRGLEPLEGLSAGQLRNLERATG
ncbi:MAG: hypothetical protein M0P73_16315 [Syntrophobacterales bacterium]|jgi:hypothetical protein|nr:hypothetical protein [Syntrophobacterales bacterium]